jgi:hypothetical protein
MSFTGAQVYVNYGWETTYATKSSSINKSFGRSVKIDTLKLSSDVERLYELNQRIASTMIYKKFDGALSLTATPGNPWLLNSVFGTYSVAGTGPYTHSFSKSNVLPSYSVEIGMAAPGGNVVRDLLGCVTDSLDITASVGDKVTMSLSGFFANEATPGSTLASQVADNFAPLTFAYGTLNIPNGTTIAKVQNVTISIKNNLEKIYGLGSRFAVQAVPKALDIEVKMKLMFLNATWLNDFLNMSTIGASSLNFTSPDGSSLEFDLSSPGVVVDHGVTGIEPNALIQEDVTLWYADAYAVAVNSVSTMP